MRHATQVKGTAKTVLLVDDEPQIVRIVSCFLCGQYNIITAYSGSEALHQSRLFQGEIHVLLSDFQMPGMTGIELATRVTRARPNMRVLLMSGYPEGLLVLNDGWHFLSKPFSLSTLRSLLAGLVHPGRSLLQRPALRAGNTCCRGRSRRLLRCAGFQWNAGKVIRYGACQVVRGVTVAAARTQFPSGDPERRP